jgi:hypothetical protein
LVDQIVNEPEHVLRHKIEARDNRHCPINQLALVIVLDVLLNRALEAQEVVDEVRKALMAYDVDVPLVEVLHYPWVRVRSVSLVSADKSVHDADL